MDSASSQPTAAAVVRLLGDAALRERLAAEARRYAAEYERRLPRAGTAAALAARSVVWGIRLRLALLEGHTTVAARLWSEGEQVLASRRSQGSGREGIYGTDIGPIVGGLLVDGRGLPALDRFVATMRAASSVPYFPLLSWARVRGRYGEWRTLRDAVYDAMPPVTASALRLRDALFLGEPEEVRSFVARSPVTRNQARTILAGSLLAFLPMMIWLIVSSVRPLNFSPNLFVFLIAFPVTTGYTILRYRLLRTDSALQPGPDICDPAHGYHVIPSGIGPCQCSAHKP